MADESSSGSSNESPAQSSQPPQPEQTNINMPTVSPTPTVNPMPVNSPGIGRDELVSRARSFLRSPQIHYQDVFAKRKFLIEKGLNEPEIELLLRELPPQLPTVPPRTYPQLPPSGLPTLLLGIARVFSWVLGGSAMLLLIYHRILMPRIIQTSRARHSLKTHQISLLQKINASLQELKEAQTDTFVSLPSPEPHKEPSHFAGCHSLNDILQQAEKHKVETDAIPHITLLRCAIEEFRNRPGQEPSADPSTEEVFQVLESKIPWLVTEEGVAFEHKLWDTLSSLEIFESTTSDDTSSSPRWKYKSQESRPPPPLMTSLEFLLSGVSQAKRTSSYQRTLQTLTEFTGYISAQVYTPYKTPTIVGSDPSNTTPEDELKKEIRALKGLVLNRRSFLPTIPRVGSAGALGLSSS